MNLPDRPSRRRRLTSRRHNALRPLVESLEQRLQLSLVAATAATQVSHGAFNQLSPSVAMDAAGDYVVAWTDQTDSTGTIDSVEAEVFSPNGTVEKGPFLVNPTHASDGTYDFSPSVAMDANGDFVVAWISSPPQANPSGDYYYEIDAQRFNLSGQAVGGQLQEINGSLTPRSAQVESPTVAMSDNSFVIGWSPLGTSGAKDTVEAQLYTFSGSSNVAVGSNFTVASSPTFQSSTPSVAMDNAGDFVFAWNSATATTGSILARAYNASGVAQGSPFSIDPSAQPFNPSVAMNGAGHFVIAYSVETNASNSVPSFNNAYAHQYALTGTEASLSVESLSGDVEVDPEVDPFDQRGASAAIDAQGFATITWGEYDDANSDGSSGDDAVDAIRINPDGSLINSTPIQVRAANAADNLSATRAASGASGNVAFAWGLNLEGNPTPGSGDQIFDRVYDYVNDAPTINTPNDVTIDENSSTTVNLAGIKAGGKEEQALTVSASSNNPSLVSPTVTYSSPNSTGTIQIDPAANTSGTATITVTVTDSGGTADGGVNTTSVQFTVTVNQVATIGTPTANPQTVAVPHDGKDVAVTLTGSDPDSPPRPLTYNLASTPAHGTLTGPAPNLTYTPAKGYHGTDSFTFTVNNGANTSSPATVTLNVATGTPVAYSQTVPTASDTPVAITLVGTDDDVPTLPLTFAIVPGQGPSGGTIGGFDPGTGKLTYTPNAGFSGPDTFEYTVSNGTNASPPEVITVDTAAATPASVNGNVGIAWGSAGSATLLTAPDGLRLLPIGRSTDIPSMGIGTLSITLSKPESLSAGDVSVTGIAVANYGPVTISGSGTSYTITLARPINSADKVAVTIGNAGIDAFTRRLDVLPGDVNDDGVVNSQDAVLARDAYLGIGTMTIPLASLDVNGDGKVDLTDYNLVRRKTGTRLP